MREGFTLCPYNSFTICKREECQIWWKCKDPRENRRKIEKVEEGGP